MDNLISEQFNLHLLFVLVLVLVISLAKFVFDNEFGSKTRKIVAASSVFTIFVFWTFGADVVKSVFYAFALFGFYDFVGRYIEQAIGWVLMKIGGWFGKIMAKIEKFFTLYNK